MIEPISTATTAAKPRAADDDRGEHLQEHGVADERIAGAGLGADEDAGEAVAAAGDHIDQKLRPGDGDALRPRGIDVAADGIDRGAEAGALQPEPQNERGCRAPRAALAACRGSRR